MLELYPNSPILLVLLISHCKCWWSAADASSLSCVSELLVQMAWDSKCVPVGLHAMVEQVKWWRELFMYSSEIVCSYVSRGSFLGALVHSQISFPFSTLTCPLRILSCFPAEQLKLVQENSLITTVGGLLAGTQVLFQTLESTPAR